MTETQIQYICDMGYDSSFRKKMLDIAVAEIGIEQFLVVEKDGTFSWLSRASIYNVCIAMKGSICFYIDGEKGLMALDLPFQNRTRYTVTKEERMAAIAYAESHNIKMPINFRSLFYEYPELITYMAPCKNVFPGEREKGYFAAALSECIKNHESAFLQESPLSEKEFCDKIVYGYNRRILNNQVFTEDMKQYPESSPASMLIRKAFKDTDRIMDGNRPLEIWTNENATPSMDKADYKLFKVIASIKKPVYERAVGNKKKGTFDIIRVWFSLISKDIMPERNAFIKENQKGFARLALARIKDDKRCKIPVNLLKIDHIGITCQNQLEFIFTLKNEVAEALTIEK